MTSTVSPALSLGSKADGSTLQSWSCARVEDSEGTPCDKRGVSLCSKCRQVKYCSKSCQTTHWKRHKADCNAPWAKEDWVPAWIKENRHPTFMSNQSDISFSAYGYAGRYFWGNVGAMDCLQWATHEGADAPDRDISLFFAASGDLRNVIKTVNGLPKDFQQTCKVFVNDFTDYISVRNLLFLCMLCDADGPSPEETAEGVLHLWYSSSITKSQSKFLNQWIDRVVPGLKVPDRDRISGSINLHGPSTLRFDWPRSAAQLMVNLARASYSLASARESMRRVQAAPTRKDYRERRIASLRPRHRASVQHWLKTGVLLPFGESVERFDCPNRILFSPQGQWLLPDSSYILDGWDPREVEVTRKQLNLPLEDLYGNIFFHIKKELIEFTKRARKLKLEFALTSEDMRIVALGLKDKRFDRIDASNVLDTIGPPAVISALGNLLNRDNPHATLLCYSMNWPGLVANATCQEQDGETIKRSSMQVMKLWVTDPSTKKLHPTAPYRDIAPFTVSSNLEAFYDHEPAFSKFLTSSGANQAAAQLGLRRRSRPSIHEARFGLPMPKASGAVEVDAEGLYMLAEIVGLTWMERFIEYEVQS